MNKEVENHLVMYKNEEFKYFAKYENGLIYVLENDVGWRRATLEELDNELYKVFVMSLEGNFFYVLDIEERKYSKFKLTRSFSLHDEILFEGFVGLKEVNIHE